MSTPQLTGTKRSNATTLVKKRAKRPKRKNHVDKVVLAAMLAVCEPDAIEMNAFRDLPTVPNKATWEAFWTQVDLTEVEVINLSEFPHSLPESVAAPNLWRLTLYRSAVAEITDTWATRFPNLEVLELRESEMYKDEDLRGLRNFTKLRDVNLGANSFAAVSVLFDKLPDTVEVIFFDYSVDEATHTWVDEEHDGDLPKNLRELHVNGNALGPMCEKMQRIIANHPKIVELSAAPAEDVPVDPPLKTVAHLTLDERDDVYRPTKQA